MGPDLAFAETKSNIVMNGSRSKIRWKEMKLKHCIPQILTVQGLSIKCKPYHCPTKKCIWSLHLIALNLNLPISVQRKQKATLGNSEAYEVKPHVFSQHLQGYISTCPFVWATSVPTKWITSISLRIWVCCLLLLTQIQMHKCFCRWCPPKQRTVVWNFVPFCMWSDLLSLA